MEELVLIKENKAFTTSRKVALKFNKRHTDVLRAIKNLDNIDGFNERNFASVDYIDEKGESRPEFIISRDGFTFLVMGFTGKEAAKFKIEFIKAFNDAEEKLKSLSNKPMSLEEMMILQLQARIQDRKDIEELKEDVKVLKAKEVTSPNNYFAVSGYASLYKINVDTNTAKKAGKQAASICKELGYVMGSVPDARYGSVKTYPVDVLDTVFKDLRLRI